MTETGEPEQPKIEFPCDYPIKVIGDMREGFSSEVVETARRFDDSLTPDKITERDSSGGKYRAITIAFWATSKSQLEDLFVALKDCDGVRMVL